MFPGKALQLDKDFNDIRGRFYAYGICATR